MCKMCESKPVYVTQNQRKLCRVCFLRYFEKKVLKTIRVHKLINNDDTIVCAVSGGKDSLTCLYILNKFFKKRGVEVKALAINEGIKGYRSETLKDAEQFCKEYKIPLRVVHVQKEFGSTLDAYLKKTKMMPCTACGIFRRYLMNKMGRELKGTKLATGHNLDDEAQSLLMNQFKGNMQLSAKLGPITGALMHDKFIKRIKPLYFMTEKEVTIYSFLKGLPVTYIECPYFKHELRHNVSEHLNALEQKYPGTKNGIINSFLDVLPELRKRYKHKEIGTCSSCHEPAAKVFCKACELLEKKLK